MGWHKCSLWPRMTVEGLLGEHRVEFVGFLGVTQLRRASVLLQRSERRGKPKSREHLTSAITNSSLMTPARARLVAPQTGVCLSSQRRPRNGHSSWKVKRETRKHLMKDKVQPFEINQRPCRFLRYHPRLRNSAVQPVRQVASAVQNNRSWTPQKDCPW